MAERSKLGYNHLDLDKLIAFRIHGVSPEFIEKLKELGYSHPDPDQLIAMRIHGIDQKRRASPQRTQRPRRQLLRIFSVFSVLSVVKLFVPS